MGNYKVNLSFNIHMEILLSSPDFQILSFFSFILKPSFLLSSLFFLPLQVQLQVSILGATLNI